MTTTRTRAPPLPHHLRIHRRFRTSNISPASTPQSPIDRLSSSTCLFLTGYLDTCPHVYIDKSSGVRGALLSESDDSPSLTALHTIMIYHINADTHLPQPMANISRYRASSLRPLPSLPTLDSESLDLPALVLQYNQPLPADASCQRYTYGQTTCFLIDTPMR